MHLASSTGFSPRETLRKPWNTGLLTGLLQTVPVAAALGIPAFRPALELLDAGGQRAVVVAGVRQLAAAGESLATRGEAATVFGFLEILVAENGPGDAGLDEEDPVTD